MVEESVEFYLRYTAVPAVLPIKTYVRTFSRKSGKERYWLLHCMQQLLTGKQRYVVLL